MIVVDSFVRGTVFYQGNLAELAGILADHGLQSTEGLWALRLFDPPSRFKIAYVGNLSPDAPFEVSVDGYGISLEVVAGWCERVARCFRDSGIGFEMTHFNADQEEIRGFEA